MDIEIDIYCNSQLIYFAYVMNVFDNLDDLREHYYLFDQSFIHSVLDFDRLLSLFDLLDDC